MPVCASAAPEAMYSDRHGLHNLSNIDSLSRTALHDGWLTCFFGNRINRSVGRGLWMRTVVDEFLQFFAGFEIRNALGRNADRVPGLWITPSPGASLANSKAAETT